MSRRATLADARPIAELQVQAWLRNYPDFVDPRHVADVDREARAAHWVESLSFGPDETFVLEVAGAVRAFATVGPLRESPAVADAAAAGAGELVALYVDPPAQGAGVGTALLAEAEQALRAAGRHQAVLRTLEGNGLARTFYERHGWSLLAGVLEPHEWGPHVVYRREL
ncbi:MAG: family N-acetyltransferase [Solirubrobacterales bacterium]|nr:family N-acetyltransferase [Solirubrobacterales bacterium]